jgi:hypothetical protein
MNKQTKKSNRPKLMLNLGESNDKLNLNEKDENKKENKLPNNYKNNEYSNLIGSQSIEL